MPSQSLPQPTLSPAPVQVVNTQSPSLEPPQAAQPTSRPPAQNRVQNADGGVLKSSQSMNAAYTKHVSAQSTTSQLLAKRPAPNGPTENIISSPSAVALVVPMSPEPSASSQNRIGKPESEVLNPLSHRLILHYYNMLLC